MQKRIIQALFAVLIMTCTGRGAEAANKAGPEFLVNTTTGGFHRMPSVARLADGGFVGVWVHRNSRSRFLVYGQRFGVDGLPLGGELLINSDTTYIATQPVVVGLNGGGFVAAWTKKATTGADGKIFARIFHPNGTPVGNEFRMNDGRVGLAPAGALLTDGSFVVTWQSGFNYRIYGRRFRPNGTPFDEFLVSVDISGDISPSVAGLSDGGFVVVWRHANNDDEQTGSKIVGRRYRANGAPQGGQFQINAQEDLPVSDPSIAAFTDSGFVVTWSSGDPFGQEVDVHGRRFRSNGQPLEEEFTVNSFADGRQYSSSVAVLEGRKFVVTWVSTNQGGTNTDIVGRIFGQKGTPVGKEFTVNTNKPKDQFNPSVAGVDGGFVVLWATQDTNGPRDGIFGQRYSGD